MKKLFTLISLLIMLTSVKAQWQIKAAGMPSQPQLGINEMIAVDNNVAWGLAYERNNAFVNPLTNFTRTIDGGKHWIAGNIHAYSNQFLLGIAPLSGTKAYVISCNSDFVGKVLKTTDGGITWSKLSVAPYPMFYQNIYFFNNMDGVIYGDTVLTTEDHHMVVFITHNGGDTWRQVPDANLPPQYSDENWYLFSSSAVGNTIWTVSTSGRVWKSVDEGLHWIANQTPETTAVVSNIKMRDAMHGLWGINDELYKTSDGGITWKEVKVKGTFFTFDLSYVPGTASTWISTGGDTSDVDFFTGGLHGLGSSYSTDDGKTWVTLDTAIDHLAIAMVSSSQGYCGGFNTGRGDGVFNYNGSALDYTLANKDLSGASVTKTQKLASLYLNVYPNPVINSATISFSIQQSQKVSIQIFDSNGRLIRMLADEQMQVGTHQITWNVHDEKGNAMNAGIYLLKMQIGNYSETKKILVIK